MTVTDQSSADDQTLVRASQRGDMAAFEELVARHRDRIYARAYSMMRNEEEAVDLSQEAWVKGWQRLAQFQGDASFGTWMTRIVINLCLDQLRKHKRQRAESIEAMDEESGGVERQMPVVTVNPTPGWSRANSASELTSRWASYRMSIARCWCCMNLKIWNIKRSPGRWTAQSARLCRVCSMRAGSWPRCWWI